MARLGRIVIDSTKLRANAGNDGVLKQDDYAEVKQELPRCFGGRFLLTDTVISQSISKWIDYSTPIVKEFLLYAMHVSARHNVGYNACILMSDNRALSDTSQEII